MMDDLNVRCARALGWELETDEHGNVWSLSGGRRFELPDFAHIDSVIPARWLEDAIEERGLWMEYTAALLPALDLERPGIAGSALWAAIRATPKQRARAFLQTVDT